LLERDVDNIVGYFERKYPQETPEIDRAALAAALTDDEFETVRNFD
jgi:RIO kinase 2